MHSRVLPSTITMMMTTMPVTTIRFVCAMCRYGNEKISNLQIISTIEWNINLQWRASKRIASSLTHWLRSQLVFLCAFSYLCVWASARARQMKTENLILINSMACNSCNSVWSWRRWAVGKFDILWDQNNIVKFVRAKCATTRFHRIDWNHFCWHLIVPVQSMWILWLQIYTK